MNNCIYIKKRKNKPFCKLLNKEIEFSNCRGCEEKEYKPRKQYKPKKVYEIKQRTYKPIKKVSKKRVFVSRETYKTVFERDKGCCVLCGSSQNLHFHHIYYRSERKDLIDNIDNGVMLCVYCHDKVHSNKKKWQPILLNMIGDVLDEKK